MKRSFIPSDGVFEIEFPFDWHFEETAQQVYKFDFKQSIGSLFLSVLDEQARARLKTIATSHGIITKKYDSFDMYEMPLGKNDFLDTIVWVFDIDGIIFQASYTYYSKHKKSDWKKELSVIYSIIGTIKVISENDKARKISWYRFGKFLNGFVASLELYNRAAQSGSFIECVLLLANQIDALLRVSLTLHNQISNNDTLLDLALIYQGESDKAIHESTIYKKSLDCEIIDNELFIKLDNLYKKRNKVVHRYIISEITTKDVLNIALEYLEMRKTIYSIVYDLESQQIEQDIGMVTQNLSISKKEAKESEMIFKTALSEKHGGIPLNKS